MPAGSTTDPLLPKAETICNGGSNIVITNLRSGVKNLHSAIEARVRLYERNNSADAKPSEEGGEGDSPGTTAEISLQPIEKTMVSQAVPLQHMDVHSRVDFHLQPVEDHTRVSVWT